MFVYLVSYFQEHGGTLIYNRPMGAFLFSMKVGVLSGLLIASPFVFSQLWLFIAPGLYAKEKRVVVPFVFFSTLLFAAGALFAHLIAFPAMWRFFASYDGMGALQFFPTVDDDVFVLCEDPARTRPDLPDADARVLPGAVRHRDGTASWSSSSGMRS